jgi:putative membrane protein
MEARGRGWVNRGARGTRTGLGVGVVALALLGGGARAAVPASTAEVLAQLHQADQKEIAAGQIAIKKGQSEQMKEYGRMLVRDHSAAEQQVAALAKQERLTLPAAPPAEAAQDANDLKAMDAMPADDQFDNRFARQMVDEHRRDIDAVTDDRYHTGDDRLGKLLDGLLPTLNKHRDAAQTIIDVQPTM